MKKLLAIILSLMTIVSAASISAAAAGGEPKNLANDGTTFKYQGAAEVFDAKTPDAKKGSLRNVAAGIKDYKLFGLYPNANAPAYPDEDHMSLTDGVLSGEIANYHESLWIGFNLSSEDFADVEDKRASMEIDLKSEHNIERVSFEYFGGEAAIAEPYEAEVFVDGKSVGSMTIEELEYGVPSCGTAYIDFETPVKGQTVKVVMDFTEYWIFVSELEIIAPSEPTDTQGTQEDSSPATGDIVLEYVIASAAAAVLGAAIFAGSKKKHLG